MKIIEILVTQIVLSISWTILCGKMFPMSKFWRPERGAIHATFVGVLASLLVAKDVSIPFVHVINIAVSGVLNIILSKRQNSRVIVEALISYIVIRMIWIIALISSYIIYVTMKIVPNVKMELICNSVLQGGLCVFACLNIHPNKWENIVSKYSLLIVSSASVLFTISYAIIAAPYYQGQRQFNNFAMLVIGASAIILIAWVFNDYQHRKELEAKTQHINDLVRTAHKYKETIPAMRQALQGIAERAGDDVAAEIGVAIEEINKLWKTAIREERQELKKAPNLDETGFSFLDAQLQREWAEADGAGVSFECMVMTSVQELEETVELFHLMQLVGDLFRNALRAIERGGGETGRILLFIGRREEGYEIKMRDTGAPFPREVLEHLGERGFTTGGTGHGMADMMEVLAQYGASLEIREEKETTVFSKTVSLLFDNKAMVRVDCPTEGAVYERALRELAKV